MRRSLSSPSARRSPTPPARRTAPQLLPYDQRWREAISAARNWRWPWTRLAWGGARVAAYVLLGIALSRLAVAIDSQPTLIREALQVGLETLAVGDLSGRYSVLPAASWRLQNRPQPEQQEPTAEPRGGQATEIEDPVPSPGSEQKPLSSGTGGPGNVERLILWEYTLPSWGEVAYTPSGTPVASTAGEFQETVAAAIQEFQERYPQVEVEVTWLNEGQVLPELARAAAGAGELPDLVALSEATIAHARASSLAKLIPQSVKFSPAALQGQRLEAGAARSFAGGDGPWVIPRWLEWQAWVGSKAIWQKLGLDTDGVIRSGWQWADVTQAIHKSLGGRSTRGSKGSSGVYLFPTAWTFTGLLLASERPTPYAWPATSGTDRWRLSGRSWLAGGESVELRWDVEFLNRVAGVWQEWTSSGGPQPYNNTAMAGWLTAAGRGELVVGGPVSPTLVKYLFDGPIGRRAGTGQESDTATTARNSNLLFLPVPTSAAGAGSVLPVRLSGYQVLTGTGKTPNTDSDRVRLAAELGLVLAHRVQAWAVRKQGFLPVEVEVTSAGYPKTVLAAYHPGELSALLQASPRQAVQPLLPPDYAKAKEQALEELVRSAPELTAGRAEPFSVAEHMREILQAPLLPSASSDQAGQEVEP